MKFEQSLKRLIAYVEHELYCGYDPYDTLNSSINFNNFGKWGPPIAIQIQKRNPINIRPLIGVKRGYNPKGMGIFLKAYCLLFKITGDSIYQDKAKWLFNWLICNYSEGYSGKCWGYNFDWASPGLYVPAYTPSVVVTSFVIDGVYEYYQITGDIRAREIIMSAANYIRKDIPITEFKEGICFSYTHLVSDCCYNASLLAAEILAKSDKVNQTSLNERLVDSAIKFVLFKQKSDGEWWYSFDPKQGVERKQIDFHQGFILISLANLNSLKTIPRRDIEMAIFKGLQYYKKYQFFLNGKSLWRIPKKWPVEIHNQSQGIITFSVLSSYDPTYGRFAETIADWTIRNMQAESGYFFYRKTPLFMNKIPFMRWSQAWMMLALAEIIKMNR